MPPIDPTARTQSGLAADALTPLFRIHALNLTSQAARNSCGMSVYATSSTNPFRMNICVMWVGGVPPSLSRLGATVAHEAYGRILGFTRSL